MTGSASPAAEVRDNQSKKWEMKNVEIGTETPVLAYPHLYETMALREGVRMFRAELDGAFDEFDDGELLKLIRVAYWEGQPCADVAARVEAAHVAIMRALNSGAMDFATRLMACGLH